MKRIGITGGIGSGKSVVCRIFEMLGIPVFYSDIVAKKVLNEDPVVKNSVAALFGPEVFDGENINRKKVAAIVFSDKNKLRALNELIHPAVGRAFRAWCENYEDRPYVLKEAAIMFESGAFTQVDEVITIAAPQELRIRRVMQRDHIYEEEVKSRMANQLPEEERISRSQQIILNDDKEMVIPQVLKVHAHYSGK